MLMEMVYTNLMMEIILIIILLVLMMTLKTFWRSNLWWVFNDKGNIHTETEADPLGLEIHAQAFGFAADNEVNDMTFIIIKLLIDQHST